MVLFVLCIGVFCLCRLDLLCTFSYVLLSLSDQLFGIAAHWFTICSPCIDTFNLLLWWFFLFYVLVFRNFLCCWRLMYVFIFLVKLR